MFTWDDADSRQYDTGVSKGIYFDMHGNGVPWSGLVSVAVEPQAGDIEEYYFDGSKYGDSENAESFQATIQAISTPREFDAAEGVHIRRHGMRTHFNKREKFNLVWRTEKGNFAGGIAGYVIHIAYNCSVQPSARTYATIADNTSPDTRTFVITSAPVGCGPDSYFTFDSREGDLSDLEAQLYSGNLPKCWELSGLVHKLVDSALPDLPDDSDCPSTIEDFEEYDPGRNVNENPRTDILHVNPAEVTVIGQINNGLEIIELPAVGAFAANDSAASEVGTGDILADDDDATYISSGDGDLGYTIGLPPLVGYLDGAEIQLHIRAGITGGVDPDDPDNVDADMQVHISTDAAGDNTIGGFSDGIDEGMSFQLGYTDGTILDYVIPLYMSPWVDSSLEDVVAALEAGAYLNVVGATNNNPDPADTPELRVYEMKVVVLDATDQGKFLRAADVTSEATVKQRMLEGLSDIPVMASNSAFVDFKVLETMYVSGSTVDAPIVLTYGALSDYSPGKVQVEIEAGLPVLKWRDISTDAELGTMPIELGVWYHVNLDFGWTSTKCRVSTVEDPDILLIDETVDATQLPGVAWVSHPAFVDDGTHLYEMCIDNQGIQVHCYDEQPVPDGPLYMMIPASHTSGSQASAGNDCYGIVGGDTVPYVNENSWNGILNTNDDDESYMEAVVSVSNAGYGVGSVTYAIQFNFPATAVPGNIESIELVVRGLTTLTDDPIKARFWDGIHACDWDLNFVGGAWETITTALTAGSATGGIGPHRTVVASDITGGKWSDPYGDPVEIRLVTPESGFSHKYTYAALRVGYTPF